MKTILNIFEKISLINIKKESKMYEKDRDIIKVSVIFKNVTNETHKEKIESSEKRIKI